MKHQYRLYGWQVSFFSGKLRAYMNFKGLDFEEKPASAYDLFKRLPKNIGASAMPALETDTGEWLGDTTDIIATLEQRHPEPSITPPAAVQQLIAILLEAWADDALIPIALHTRWSHPENYECFREEGSKALFPFAPARVRNFVVDNTAAKRMRGALSRVGVTDDQKPLLDDWILDVLDELATHLNQNPYLLGNRPCVADYSLAGLFYAHLNNDCWPERELMRPRPSLQDYTKRTHDGTPAGSSWHDGDSIPGTLMPLLRRIAHEFIPMIEATVVEIKRCVEDRQLKTNDSLPRALSDIAFPMGTGTYVRHSFSHTVWKMQRLQTAFLNLSESAQTEAAELFSSIGIPLEALDLGPALKRQGLGTALA